MTLRSWAVTAAVGISLLTVALAGFSPDANAHQIHVTLFGQPCTLEGPQTIDVPTLKLIHAISPEQLYPGFDLNGKASAFRSALDKLRSSKGLPDEFDTYRDRLTKRLQAQAAFLSGLAESERVKRAEPLLSATREYISSETRQKAMETGAKKLETNLNAAQRKEIAEQLFNTFSEAMPSDPEEDFHQAIHRLKIQYVCTFEESGSDHDDSAD